MKDLSRRPHESPKQVSEEVVAAMVAARLRWKWGPRKLLVKLRQQDSERQWAAVSTIAAVLKSHVPSGEPEAQRAHTGAEAAVCSGL